MSAVVLLVGLSGPAFAQVSIQVVDAEGRPVPDVSVEVYGRGELFEVVSTSARGFAELSPERWADVRRITFRHLAFPTLIVQAADMPADGVIQLEPRTTPIEGFTVQGTDLCPIQDDLEARRLWSEVASRYASDTGSRSWSAYLSRYGDRVEERDLRRSSDDEAVDFVSAGGPFVIHGGDHNPRSLDHRISREGYSWPPLVVGGTTSSREVAWAYPALDGSHAYHFASLTFGSLHDFAVATEATGEATLVFCGNGGGTGSTMKGVITLTKGGEFLSAEWRFETSEPDEGAGGSVSFASLSDSEDAKPHLVASRGVFYRHSGMQPQANSDFPRRYVRFVTTESRWHLNPSADKPCNEGLSYYGYPPTSPEGLRFAACVEKNWGRD